MPVPIRGSVTLLGTLTTIVAPDPSYDYTMSTVYLTNISANPGLVTLYVDQNDLSPAAVNRVVANLYVPASSTMTVDNIFIGRGEKLIGVSAEASVGNPTTIAARVQGMAYNTGRESLVTGSVAATANSPTPVITVPNNILNSVGFIRAINTNSNQASVSSVTLRASDNPITDADTMGILTVNGGEYGEMSGVVFVPGEQLEVTSDTNDLIIRASFIVEY